MRIRRTIAGVSGRRAGLASSVARSFGRARAALVRLPLRWRLAGVSLGLLLVLTIGLGVLTVVYERAAMLNNQAATLRGEAQLALRGSLGGLHVVPVNAVPPPTGPLVPDVATATILAHRLASATTEVVVYLPDGTVMASSDQLNADDEQAQPPAAAQATAAQVQDAASNPHDASWYVLLTNAAGQRQIATLVPVMTADPRTGNLYTVLVLQIATPTAAIDQTVTATRLMLALGVLLALVIGALVTPPLVRAALKPLDEMERKTALIAAGDLSQRLEVPPTSDEIGQLARSFNLMVARLDAAFARQKQFVADVSHELRTPLTALGGGMEMLLIGAEAGDPEASRRLLRGMYAEVERMRRLVEDLLTLTRLDEGKIQLRIERLDPDELMTGIFEQARHLARGQEMRLEVEPRLPEIQADADRLRQVLLNLVDNALKFTPPPGVVTLRAHRDGSRMVALEVEDTGTGIAAAALPHVFERFYRADPSRARAAGQVGGSGLGLAIAKSLVEACGGTITIASMEGHGTRVIVRFPAQAGERASPSGRIALAAPAERP